VLWPAEPRAREGATFAGAGAHVFSAIPAIHSEPEIFPAPFELRPGRFLERTFAPHEYLPFGVGNRLCLGWALATFELRLLIATFQCG
jgi:cytochrome P450